MGISTQGYTNLIHTITYERLSGEVAESFSNDWMKRGSELQPLAAQSYELETFSKILSVGIVEQDEWVACSPDGLIEEDGLIEIKCPKFSSHLEYLFSRKVPKDYYAQIQFQLMVTERIWCDFYSFHPKLPGCRIRVERDGQAIEFIKLRLTESIKLVQERINKLGEMRNGR